MKRYVIKCLDFRGEPHLQENMHGEKLYRKPEKAVEYSRKEGELIELDFDNMTMRVVPKEELSTE